MSTGYAVRGEAIEALALGSGPEAGNVVGTLDHVPGSVLRGALAAAWLRDHGSPTAAPGFVVLFERSIGFGPLRPLGATVTPLSVLRCKYRPDDGCAAVAHDLIEHLDDPAPPRDCPVCQGPLEPAKGEQVLPLGAAPVLVQRTRTRLDDDERASDGELFTRRALAPGTILTGTVTGSDPWLDGFGTTTVWCGGRRSVGGRCRLQLTTCELPAPAGRDDGRVVVRCTSPTVLVDRAGAPLLEPDAGALSELLGTPVKVMRGWRRPTTIGGWNAVAGLPKPVDLAVVAGSVFVLTTDDGVDADALAELAAHGLGLRRPEGLGCIEVNPPAWSPPPPLTSATDERPEARTAAELKRCLGERADRRWVAGRLKEAAAAREVGQVPEDASTLRRARPWPPAARAVLKDALARTDPGELRAMATDLEVER